MILSGGSPIISYSLYIDDGNNGAFTEVVGDTIGDYTLDSVLISTSITSGATYRMKYKVKNIYGFSLFSPIATIIAMSTPGSPGIPSTAYDSADNVVVSWTAPVFTGGSLITLTAYDVLILS